MSEFDAEVKRAEKELEQSLAPLENEFGKNEDEFLGDVKMEPQVYGNNFQETADKARVFAEAKLAWAGDKFKEFQNKDPKEFVKDAKEFARQKPGQTILISAAIGLAVGMLLRRK